MKSAICAKFGKYVHYAAPVAQDVNGNYLRLPFHDVFALLNRLIGKNITRNSVIGEVAMRKLQALLLCLLCAVLLTGTAGAEGALSGLLFESMEVDEAALAKLTPYICPVLDGEIEENGVRFHVKEAYYDGEWLAVAWTYESLDVSKPLMLEYTGSGIVNKRALNVSMMSPGMVWLPHIFQADPDPDYAKPQSGGAFFHIGNRPEETLLEAEFKFAIYRPIGPIAIVDRHIYEGGYYHYPQDIPQALAWIQEEFGIKVAGMDELDEQAWMDEGYAVFPYDGTPGTEDVEGGKITGDNLDGRVVRDGSITVRFKVDISDLPPSPILDLTPEGTYSFDGGDYTFQKVEIGPLQTVLEYSVIIDNEDSDSFLSRHFDMYFVFTDDEGNVIQPARYSIGSSGGLGSSLDEDGNVFYEGDRNMHGLSEIPSTMLLVSGFPTIDDQTVDDLKKHFDVVVVPLAKN